MSVIEFEAKLKKWGNSMGLVIPQKKLMEGRFSPNGSVRVLLSSSDRLRVKDIWGKLPKGKKSAVSLLKEIDKELDSKFF